MYSRWGTPPEIKQQLLAQSESKTGNLNKTYCIFISKLKGSSVHQFILEVQLILATHDLLAHNHFWPHPSFSSIHLEILQVLQSHDLNWHANFWWRKLRYFSINFSFLWISIKMRKFRLFHNFVLDIQWI